MPSAMGIDVLAGAPCSCHCYHLLWLHRGMLQLLENSLEFTSHLKRRLSNIPGSDGGDTRRLHGRRSQEDVTPTLENKGCVFQACPFV